MPTAPAKPCKHRGCPEIVLKGGYCFKHKAYERAVSKDFEKSLTRDRDRDPFYGSGRWKRLRKYHLQANPLCQHCQKPAQVVHHEQPRQAGGDDMAMNNLVSLCSACHNSAHRGRGVMRGAA